MNLEEILDILYLSTKKQAIYTNDTSLYPVGYLNALIDVARLTNTTIKTAELEKQVEDELHQEIQKRND